MARPQLMVNTEADPPWQGGATGPSSALSYAVGLVPQNLQFNAKNRGFHLGFPLWVSRFPPPGGLRSPHRFVAHVGGAS